MIVFWSFSVALHFQFAIEASRKEKSTRPTVCRSTNMASANGKATGEIDVGSNWAAESTVSGFSQDLQHAGGDRKRYHLSLLKKLPRYRDTVLEMIFPYYAIGHDITTSSMSGILFAPNLPAPRNTLALAVKAGILPGNGEFAYFRHDHGDQHITLEGLTDDERSKLNFFHGGCGDCRHVYATLYDLGRQLQSGSGDTLKGNRVHFVLNDSSHAILARCAVMLAGLEELARFPMEDIRKKERQDVNLLLAFLHYVLLSPVVPSYVNEKLCEIMQRLVDDPTQYRSFTFAGDTWEGVRRVLEIWLNPMRQDGTDISRSAEEVAEHYRDGEHNEVMRNIGETVIEYGKIASDYLNSNHLDELAKLSDVQVDSFFSMLNNIGLNMARIVHSNLKALNVQGDVVFTAVHQVLPPPKQLLSLHSPAVQRCHQLAHKAGDEIREDGRLIEGITRCALHTAAEDFSHSTVVGEYHTNMTGIEPVTDPELSRINPDEAEVGQLAHHWNALRFILAGCHVRASAGDLAVHGALIACVCVCPCVCVRVCPVSNSFFITPRIGTRFVLLTGKHPVVGQLPRVSFSALPGQSSDRPNLPPHPSAITALFLDRSLVVVHLTGHDQIMTVEILRTMAIASPQSGQATARGLPEVFHVSARSRWIA